MTRAVASAGRGFDFGRNWAAYATHRADAGRLDAAAASLAALLAPTELAGKSFLDVGSGSGLFAVAAARLGATPVVAIDVDPECVRVGEELRERLAPGTEVTFRHASALDPVALRALGRFAVVYAWGSLHHTGAMWRAIELVAERVADDGVLALALYNRHLTSGAWRIVKRGYNAAPRRARWWIAAASVPVIWTAKVLVVRGNPLRKARGMDFWHDVVDWVGGYPYEVASRSEVEARVERAGFALRRFVAAEVPTGCNEYVFDRVVPTSPRPGAGRGARGV